MVSDVLIIRIPHRAGSLQELLDKLAERDISIEYMYGLSVGEADACVVMKTGDLERAKEVLRAHAIVTMSEEELASL